MRVVREEGVLALWRGCSPTVTRAMIVTASQMAVYDKSNAVILAGCGVLPSCFLASLFIHGGGSGGDGGGGGLFLLLSLLLLLPLNGTMEIPLFTLRYVASIKSEKQSQSADAILDTRA